MNPFDLIPWAFAIGFSLVILAPGGRDHHCGLECWEADVTADRIIRTLAAASNLAVAAALVYFTRWITKKGF